MQSTLSELFRLDRLTGCKNYLGFLETLWNLSLTGGIVDERSRGAITRNKINENTISAVLIADMNGLHVMNERMGLDYGDSAIRWMGILLQEECKCDVFRLGGDEFAVLLKLETRAAHLALIEHILERMDREAINLGFQDAAAETALILFDQTPISMDVILMIMGEAVARVKTNRNPNHYTLFNPTELLNLLPGQVKQMTENGLDYHLPLRWLSVINIYQVLGFGKLLDETQQEAYTDAISGLPNMKAALFHMDNALKAARENHKPFSMLMIDGDNLKFYNNINYAAGDQMIRDVCAVLQSNLRPNDFLARWRTGDEFLVILPDTPIEGARIVGERFRLAVKEASRAWHFPVSISIGAAAYPLHGEDNDGLINRVEIANQRAKQRGKDQVVVAD